MKKIINIAILGLFVVVLTLSCTKEEVLEPSGKTFGYKLPQGDSDYDDRIMDYNKKYSGMMILYDFKANDAYRTARYDAEAKVDPNNENAYLSTKNGIYTSGFLSTYYFIYYPVAKAYINQQLDLLEECFFSLYDAEFFKKISPAKILLTSALKNPVFVGSATTGVWELKDLDAVMIADNTRSSLSVSWGSESILTMTPAQKKSFMMNINDQFMRNFLEANGQISIPNEFAVITNYKALDGIFAWPEMYKNGMIINNNKSAAADWKSYYNAIINNTVEFMEEFAADDDKTNKGILCSDKTGGQKPKDSTGKIRKKYNIVLNYYKKNFGIDLTDFQKKKFE